MLQLPLAPFEEMAYCSNTCMMQCCFRDRRAQFSRVCLFTFRVRQARQNRHRPSSRLGFIRCELRNPSTVRQHVFVHYLCVFHPLQNCARTLNFWRRVNRRSRMAYSGWISTKDIELKWRWRVAGAPAIANMRTPIYPLTPVTRPRSI